MNKELLSIKVFDNPYNDTFGVEIYSEGLLSMAMECGSWEEVVDEIMEYLK